MAEINILQMTCDRCRVAPNCPRRGSSPLKDGRMTHLCRILGGYGRRPIDPEVLSPETSARVATDGPCMTLAEVPVRDEDSGFVQFRLTKIFSHPVLHEREKSTELLDRLYPKSNA